MPRLQLFFERYLFNFRETYVLEPRAETRAFYRIFLVATTLWFLSLPLVVAVSEGIKPYRRLIAIDSLNLIVTFLIYAFFTFMFYPSRIGEYCPHIVKEMAVTIATASFADSTDNAAVGSAIGQYDQL